MKLLAVTLIALAPILTGCISSSSPAAPAKNTTVVVPQGQNTTVVCSDGTHPPCN